MAISREDAIKNPAATNAAIAEIVAEAKTLVRPDAIDLPPSDTIELPCGLVREEKLFRVVHVQELTGKHEEALARAIIPAPGSDRINWAHFMQVLLECGVTSVEDLNHAKSKELLKELTLGDRDAIVLGIRLATYGDEVELQDWVCPACAARTAITLSITEDVEIKKADPYTDLVFDVPLRKGRVAKVRVPTGADLQAMQERDGITAAERESILISRCLLRLTDANGNETPTVGMSSSIALNLPIPDRKAIVREMDKRQPGPRYNGITFVHQDCGQEVALGLGLGELFPDLV